MLRTNVKKRESAPPRDGKSIEEGTETFLSKLKDYNNIFLYAVPRNYVIVCSRCIIRSIIRLSLRTLTCRPPTTTYYYCYYYYCYCYYYSPSLSAKNSRLPKRPKDPSTDVDDPSPLTVMITPMTMMMIDDEPKKKKIK